MSGRKKAMENRIIFLISGLFTTGVAVYINFNDVVLGHFPNALMLLAVGVSQLIMAYLSPHLFPRDERSKMIWEKSMFLNYFVILGTIIILLLITGPFGHVSWDAQQVLKILFTVYILSITSTMVIYSKVL